MTFTLAAALLAATPGGGDTALVLRTLVSSGARRAVQAGLGIAAGCLVWGAVVALGLGTLLTASALAFNTVKVLRAVYLVWQGIRLWRRPSSPVLNPGAALGGTAPASAFLRAFGRMCSTPKWA